MSSLDFWNVHKTRTATNETTTRKGQLWNALKATFVQGSCTITNPGTTFKGRPHTWMSLELLEGLEWVNIGIFVIQTDHKANSDEIILGKMVQK